MKKICINCAPLTNRITGSERCIYENLKEMDTLAENQNVCIELLYPDGAHMNFPPLKNLQPVPIKPSGNKLNLFALRRYLRKNDGLYVSIHGGICIARGSIICTNDIRSLVHKKYDPVGFRIKCTINALTSKWFAGQIVTISETARKEICETLRIKKDKVVIISPGWEHIAQINPDDSIWNRLDGVEKGHYFYSLSSRAPHKNFRWVEEIAKRTPNEIFLVGGQRWNHREYSNENIPDNVRYLGYVTDEENVELMKHCKAFMHPSKYEGFGMTPLEALACGAQICVSNASCLPEIFQNCAHYFDPDDYEIDLDKLLLEEVEKPEKVLEKYSWKKSSKQWYDLLIKNLRQRN